MKRNNLNRFLFLVLVLAWAAYEMTPLQNKDDRLLDRFVSQAHETNKVVITDIRKTAKTNFDAQAPSEKNEYGALMSSVKESGVALSDHYNYKFSGKKTTEEMNNLIHDKVIVATMEEIKLKNGKSALSIYDKETCNLHINPSGKFLYRPQTTLCILS